MRVFVTLIMLAFCVPSMAKPLSDATLEDQAQTLFAELRCMVCEGQSLAGSDTPLAQEMRALVREKLANGHTPDAIKVFFVDRYGEAILQSPPVNQYTGMLWALPLILTIIGGTVIALTVRRKPESSS